MTLHDSAVPVWSDCHEVHVHTRWMHEQSIIDS
jgi:hypothetical protein